MSIAIKSLHISFLFLSVSNLVAQFPKAYMADAIAAPTIVSPGEGDYARKLLLLEPETLAIDAQNNLYVSDSKFNRVVKITPAGKFSTYAGTGGTGRLRLRPGRRRNGGLPPLWVSPLTAMAACTSPTATPARLCA